MDGHDTLLTYSMVQSPSWKANWFAAGQEIPRISRNPKVHYRTHKRPPLFPILGQPSPVHIPTSHLLQVHANIIHPSMPRSPQWSLSLRFSHQDPSPHPYAPHAQPISWPWYLVTKLLAAGSKIYSKSPTVTLLDTARVSKIFILNLPLAQLIAIQDFSAFKSRKTSLISISIVTSS